MVMYDNEFKTKGSKILTKDKIEPQHINRFVVVPLSLFLTNLFKHITVHIFLVMLVYDYYYFFILLHSPKKRKNKKQ